MKFIKSFLIVTVILGASTIARAQSKELKTDPSKPVVTTVPPPGTKPALAPDIKPDMKNETPLKQSEQQPVSAPSPLSRDEQIKDPLEKPKVILADDKASTSQSLGAENLKTLNGTAERPKQAALTNDQAVKPLPPAAPAVIKN